MVDEATQRSLDAEDHRKTYESVMRFSSSIGVPFSLGLTMFFTNLVMVNGFGVALVAAVITYLVTFFIVKTFFSH